MDYGWLIRHTLIPFFGHWVNRVQGAENLPRAGGFIIASNHNSWIDAPIIISAFYRLLERKIYFIAASGKYAGLGGLTIDWKDKKKVISDALKVLANQWIVGIFPEGRSNKDTILLKGKTGVARLALWSGLPVVPVGILGTKERKPFQAIRSMIKAKKNIRLNIGQPLYFKAKKPAQTRLNDLYTVTDNIMSRIAEMSEKKHI